MVSSPIAARLTTTNMNATNVPGSVDRSGPGCEVCPLSLVKTGVAVRIKQLCAAPAVASRLREIGFCEDQIIRLLTSQTNYICQVCNARLAISAKLAQAIMVEPVLQRVV